MAIAAAAASTSLNAFVSAPLIAECYANLGCRVVDIRLVNRYRFFVLEVVKGIDPAIKETRTLHHSGCGVFMVAGEMLKLPSKVK